jgi:hypothetical protein
VAAVDDDAVESWLGFMTATGGAVVRRVIRTEPGGDGLAVRSTLETETYVDRERYAYDNVGASGGCSSIPTTR